MTPLSSSSHSSPDAQSIDRPERSRNARAQARHRAKRKAYIEQLEQTVTKLQTVLALSPDQVAALPPPLVRIRELEEENEILHREIDDLRHQLELRNARLRPDIGRRGALLTTNDDIRVDREARRRRLTESSVYMSSSASCAHSPPPPLMIPSSAAHHSTLPSQASPYGKPPSSATPTSLMQTYNMYTVPGTPSGSSSTSSSSFSPADYTPPSAPHHTHTTAHRAASSAHPLLPQYSHTTGQYELVKLEEDSYQQHHAISHANGYASAALHPYTSGEAANMTHWQAYSGQRS